VQALSMLSATVDAIFLDGFAPERNPALWSQPVLNALFKLSKVGTQLSTWCATGEIRRRLKQAGFEVHPGPGIGTKRETTLARVQSLPSRHPLFSSHFSHRSNPQRKVIVLGAGLAGTAVTERLVHRGWEVSLIDAARGPAQAASGNPSGVVRPLISRDDNRSSQFTRASLLYAIQRWERLHLHRHPAWHPTGVVQIARDAAQLEQWQEMLSGARLPGEWVQFFTQAEATRFCGYPVPYGGLLFPLAGWAEPILLCQQSLDSAPNPVRTYWNKTIEVLKRSSDVNQDWLALDTQGNTIDRAPHVIIASGAGPHIEDSAIHSFLPASLRPLQRLRGEITQFDRPLDAHPLEIALCGEGYVCPTPDGSWSVGATYDETPSFQMTPKGIQENTDKLKLLMGIPGDECKLKGGRASYRSVAWDRLPLIGADPEQAGIWHCRALASRGLAWHGLAAELLVSQMECEPLPLSAKLAEAVSPSRSAIQLAHP